MQFEIEQATQIADLGRAAELRYGKLPELQRAAGRRNASVCRSGRAAGQMLKEEVDEEDIAEVVAKWTGIPVSRLMEAEMQKLLKMEERLRMRVVGQDAALESVADAVRRARAGLARPESADRSASSSLARPASAKPSWRGLWPNFCSMTSAPWFAST